MSSFLMRMKTTVNIPDIVDGEPLPFDVSEDDINDLLGSLDSPNLDEFAYSVFMPITLGRAVQTLSSTLMFGKCSCSTTYCNKCVFRMKKDSRTRTQDMNPIEYLETVNRMRLDHIDASTDYNDIAYKIVKRVGNVCSHLLFAHVEASGRDLLDPIWRLSCLILAFRRHTQRKNYESSRATRCLAESMVSVNKQISAMGQEPFSFHKVFRQTKKADTS